MALQQTISVSSATAGPILSVTPSSAWNLATQGTAALTSVVNPALQAADQQAAPGTLLALSLTGWTVPLIGYSFGPMMASRLNTAFAAGQITYQGGNQSGQPVQPWPVADWAGAFATYAAGSDTITLRWVAGDPGLLSIILIILGVLVGISLLEQITGIFGGTWGLHGFTSTAATASTTPGWWSQRPFWEKILIVGGSLGIASFGLYVYGEEKIHAAGAAHSSINVINEPSGGYS